MPEVTRVYLEIGKTWTFACALDWPGWCRRAKGAQAALDELMDYAPRYAPVAGSGFDPGNLEIVGQLQGNATTDFGAPSITGDWDEEALSPTEAGRLATLLEATWRSFDDVVAGAPAELQKGPRGGGRDRDLVVAHVQGAERSYCRKIGVDVPPRTAWAEQRVACLDVLRAGATSGPWPARYAVRRIAWHVMDHAWEIEDRST
ncbi:MAG: hypothetical protein JWO62_3313 [Acidimicrobiaceae bacterium]|nr:hypothetical protein [Acidimicrobiaceae bacterium]